MMKITRMRAATMLAGVSLAVAGVLAGGGPAVAGRAAGHQDPRAAALAQILRHGASFRPGATGVRTASLPAGGRRVPKPGKFSELSGVFCTSSGNCWAVGEYTPSTSKAELNEVLHWNGKKWSQVTVVSPGGTGADHFSDLFSARCTSARNCWAVGYYSNGKADFNQALHWNGKKWSRVPTPTPGGTLRGDQNELFDINCTSSTSCWADGEYGNQSSSGETILNQILHWNGRAWSVVHSPNPGGTGQDDVQAIDAIRCASARDCLAIGTYGTMGTTFILRNEALRWNGTKWSKLTTPNPGGTTTNGDFNELIGLGCANASNCWAVGTYGNFGTETFLNEILHWNGKKWSKQTTPNPAGTGTGASNELIGANCISATSCWAVGDYGVTSGGTGEILNEALRWNGKKWSLVSTPNPAGSSDNDQNDLFAVRCSSPSFCWAVGDQQKSGGAQVNEALRWNGTKWSTG